MWAWLAAGFLLAIVLPAAGYAWSIRRVGREPLSGAGWLLLLYYGLMAAEPAITLWALRRVSVPALLLNSGLFFIVGPLMAWAFVSTARRGRPSQKPDRAPQCRSCGYDLTGNVSGVCPECGTRVSVPPPRG